MHDNNQLSDQAEKSIDDLSKSNIITFKLLLVVDSYQEKGWYILNKDFWIFMFIYTVKI